MFCRVSSFSAPTKGTPVPSPSPSLPPVALLILSVASYSPSITSANLCVNSTQELGTTFGVCKLCKAVWKRFCSKKAPARIFFDSSRSCGANNFSKRLAV